MVSVLSRNWWMFLVRGIVAILLGLIFLFAPGIGLTLLVGAVAAYFLVDGLFNIVYALQHRGQPRWWANLLEGIIGVLAAIGTFILGPLESGVLLIYVIGVWAIITGVTSILFAIEIRRQIDNEWMIIAGGLLSILFGVLLILFPGTGLFAVLSIIGAYAIIAGILLIVFAFRVRGMGSGAGTQVGGRAAA